MSKQTGPPIFDEDTKDIGVLHARKLYRAKRWEELKGLEFVFDDDGELVCLNPPPD